MSDRLCGYPTARGSSLKDTPRLHRESTTFNRSRRPKPPKESFETTETTERMSESSSVTRTALSAIWAALHTTQYGLAITTLNGISDAVTCNIEGVPKPTYRGSLRPCIDMTVCIAVSAIRRADQQDTQFGVVVSIFTLGGLIGSFSSDFLTRRYGRINTFRISALCTLLGSICAGTANRVGVMLLGR